MTDSETDPEAPHRERMRLLQAEQRAKVASKEIRHKGLLIVYTGAGKGKSTAALGLAMRAVGHGQRVAFVQFIKGKWKTGEQTTLRRFPEIEHIISGEGFTWDTQDLSVDIAAAEHGWGEVERLLASARQNPEALQLLILDELNIALRYRHLDLERVLAALGARPPQLHVVVTGRDAPPALVDLADTVTVMEPLKHAFEAGVRAQRGIEF